MTTLETALILSYLHSDQLTKCLETVLGEMKDMDDPRTGKFQSLLEKLQGASKRAFANVEKNIEDKQALEEDLWEIIGQNWDAVKKAKT